MRRAPNPEPSLPERVTGRDLARRLGVSPTLIAGAHHRLGIGEFQTVEVVARRRLLVFTPAEVEAVLADLAQRAHARRAGDAALVAAVEELAARLRA